jgi:hypothetical protein
MRRLHAPIILSHRRGERQAAGRANTGDQACTPAMSDASARIPVAVPGARVEWIETDREVHSPARNEIALLLLDAFPS